MTDAINALRAAVEGLANLPLMITPADVASHEQLVVTTLTATIAELPDDEDAPAAKQAVILLGPALKDLRSVQEQMGIVPSPAVAWACATLDALEQGAAILWPAKPPTA